MSESTKQLTTSAAISAIENVLINGNLADLTPEQRVEYCLKVCESLGLNPLTKPLEYITLQGKLTLYANKEAAAQLRKNHGFSIVEISTKIVQDVFIVTAKVQDGKGRTDVATGAVPIKGLTGDKLANALMKAETKAKRRVTLSLGGLGFLDETELETIPAASIQLREKLKLSAPVPSNLDHHYDFSDLDEEGFAWVSKNIIVKFSGKAIGTPGCWAFKDKIEHEKIDQFYLGEAISNANAVSK